MPRSRTYYPNLARALPAGDELAKLAARALVLYGDLLIEWSGTGEEHGLEMLEKLGANHRQLYFFRASCVTLQSCNYLIQALMKNPSFRGWLVTDADAGANFKTAKAEFDKHRSLIDRLRNGVGAHAEEDIGNAIARFEPDEVAPIEWHSSDILRPHLATRILINTILENCPREREGAEIEKILGDINAATKAMTNILTEFLGMYARRYPLLPD